MLGLRPTTLHATMKKLGIRRPSTVIARVDDEGGIEETRCS
jgi:hypothetical protein